MRSIILGVSSAVVAIFFMKLVFDSQGAREPDVDETELAKALAEYKRTEARSSSSTAAVTPTVPRRKTTGAKNASKRATTSSADARKSEQTFVKPPPLEPREEEVDTKSRMDDANRLYDRADYEGARDAALELLEEEDSNVRMLRIVVSSSCIMGDEEVATTHYAKLPSRDQRQMARRCKRYGIEFDDQEL